MGDEKKAILARRAYFVAAALASAGIAAPAVTACGGDSTSEKTDAEPQPCLKFAPDSGTDGEPEPCLGMPAPDAGADAEPRPCLDVAIDSGITDAETD